jgi:antitoxin component YwqK of YwqJK toxin-antitoxin module
MKRVGLYVAIASVLAGCSKEYNESEVKTDTSTGYGLAATVTSDGKRITGDVIERSGDVFTLKYYVEDGRINGDYVRNYEDGSPKYLAKVDHGKVMDETTFCAAPNKGEQKKVTVLDGLTTTVEKDCGSGLVTASSTMIDGAPQKLYVGEMGSWAIVDGKQIPLRISNYSSDRSGNLDGVQQEFYEDGHVSKAITYKDGKLAMLEQFDLFKDGTYAIASRTTYKDGGQEESISFFTGPPWKPDTISKRQTTIIDESGDSSLHSVSYGDNDVFVYNSASTPKSQEGQVLVDNIVNSRGWRATPSAQTLVDFEYLVTTSKIDLNNVYVGQNPLITVVPDAYYDTMVRLGANPEAIADDGSNRLMMCLRAKNMARKCSVDHMMALAAQSKSPTKQLYGRTAASYLCENERSIFHDMSGITPLEMREKLFAEIIKAENVNAEDYRGRISLHLCVSAENKGYAKMLVAAGANREKQDIAGLTPAQTIFVSTYLMNPLNLSWSADEIAHAEEIGKGTSFSFHKPFPGFDQSLQQIFIKNGDAPNARLVETMQ